ncbi:MAG: RusA family crossover junction endodeoxyribonuclease [Desulfobacteraceae bacterium]|nr:RusA family crossover junction endodeoxyribonuclease [Desulfobacteraceae bacterium]
MEEKKINFEIPGQPQSKLRARWSGHHTYTPDRTVSYETYIKEMFVISYPDFIPLEGALRMTVVAYMMIPKSTSKKRMKLMIDRVIRPTKKPDISNILKSAEDALNSLAYHDDKQIVTAICHKYYAIRPRLEIEITGARI